MLPKVRRIILWFGALALMSCNEQEPAFSDADMKLIRAEDPGMKESCLEKLRLGGVLEWERQNPDCLEMQPKRRWSGMWNAGWEWSNFCPAPARECPSSSEDKDIWLVFAEGTREDPRLQDGIYAIEFVGRRTKLAGPFGHLNQYDHLIVVDRLISLRRVAEN